MNVKLSSVGAGELDKLMRWRNDPDLKHMIMSEVGPQAEREVLKWIDDTRRDPNQRLLGIYDETAGSSELVGLLRFMFIDSAERSSNLGIYIGDAANRGKGIGRMALTQAIEYALHDLKLRCIKLKVLECNSGALRLYESFGFQIVSVDKEGALHGSRKEAVFEMSLNFE